MTDKGGSRCERKENWPKKRTLGHPQLNVALKSHQSNRQSPVVNYDLNHQGTTELTVLLVLIPLIQICVHQQIRNTATNH